MATKHCQYSTKKLKIYTEDKLVELTDNYQAWIKDFLWCDYCQKREKNINFFFIDHDKDISFCSQKCQNEWNIKNSAQNYLDYWYPVDGTCTRRNERDHRSEDTVDNYGKRRDEIIDLDLTGLNLTGALNLAGFVNLDYLECDNNHLTSININNCPNLKLLKCEKNKIEELILPVNNKLTSVYLSNNLLRNLNYSNLNPTTLADLTLINNNIQSTSLTVFEHLTNLETLWIGNDNKSKIKKDIYNRFHGSLKPLRNLTNLRELIISKTNVDCGLEYLSDSLRTFYFEGTKLEYQLALHNNNLASWKVAHSDLAKKSDQKTVEIDYESNLSHEENELIVNIINPSLTLEEHEIGFKPNRNNNLSNLDYSKFIFRDERISVWEDKNKPLLTKENLPIKLYHIPTNTVVWSKNHSDVSFYAIMSYIWGDLSDKENLTTWDYFYENENKTIIPKQIGVYPEYKTTGTTKESIKALRKAIIFCKSHDIDYLWMDQLCIDQFDNREKELEVPKMREYYSHATATMVAVDIEVGNQIDQTDKDKLSKHLITLIVDSQWFSRVWTFQEGLLSKQTIFMFDDFLVDGRILAQHWGGSQFKMENWTYETENNRSIVHITPLGWSYGSKPSDNFNLTLGQALNAVNERNRTILVDSIYAVLGLLSYGKKVEVKYKENICCDCKIIEHQSRKTIACSHPIEQRTEFPNYFPEDLETAFQGVLKAASWNDEDQKEIFSWIGPRRNENWLIPKIDRNGKSCIENVINSEQFEVIKQSIIKVNKNDIHLKNIVPAIVKSVRREQVNAAVEFLSIVASFKKEEQEIYLRKFNDLEVEAGDNLILFERTLDRGTAIIIPNNFQNHAYICYYNCVEFKNSSKALINIKERKVIKGSKKINAYRDNLQSELQCQMEQLMLNQ